MNLVFNSVVKHNRLLFSPAIVYSIPDEVAAAYFVAMGWAVETTDTPLVEIATDDLTVNPDTVYGDGPQKGQKVLGG